MRTRYFHKRCGFCDGTAIIRFTGEMAELMYREVRAPKQAGSQHLKCALAFVASGSWHEINEAEARRTYPAAFVYEDMLALQERLKEPLSVSPIETLDRLDRWAALIKENNNGDW